MQDLTPVALVTGANRGIGREIARQLAAQGLTVVSGARDPAKASDLEGVVKQLDVSDPDSAERAVREIEDELGRLDVLVNNAGIGNDFGQSAQEADLERIKEALETNLFGAWRLASLALPLMKRHGYGRIVNLSSGMGQLEDMGGGSPGYRLSKTGLNALTRMLAAELGEGDIKVNSVCPGWVRTDMGTDAAPRSVEEGADTAVWLATLPADGPTGGFFRDRRPVAW